MRESRWNGGLTYSRVLGWKDGERRAWKEGEGRERRSRERRELEMGRTSSALPASLSRSSDEQHASCTTPVSLALPSITSQSYQSSLTHQSADPSHFVLRPPPTPPTSFPFSPNSIRPDPFSEAFDIKSVTEEDKLRILSKHLVSAQDRRASAAPTPEPGFASSSALQHNQSGISLGSSDGNNRSAMMPGEDGTEEFTLPYDSHGGDVTFVRSSLFSRVCIAVEH